MNKLKSSIKRKGSLFILSAPSGVGKSTLVKKLTSIDKDLKPSISVTTREQRKGEVEGVDYFFKDKNEFYNLIEQNAFLEYAEVYGNFYGTLKSQVEKQLQSGFDVIMDIDWQGTTLIKDRMPDDVLSIFILPPSIDELERRLRSRNRDSDDIIRYRMAKSRSEIAFFYKYDYIIVNDTLEDAINDTLSIISCNRKRVERMYNVKEIIDKL